MQHAAMQGAKFQYARSADVSKQDGKHAEPADTMEVLFTVVVQRLESL